jgi:D-alanine-D-alanine ligase
VLLNRESDIPAALQTIGLPLAVKPAREGSSIGMTRVTDESQMKAAFALARDYDPNVIAERWIDGPEYTAGVLGDVVLPLIRIETPRDYYDYKAKYLSDSTRYHCPSGLADDVERTCRHQSFAAFNATGARGWGRVDFLLSADNKPLFLEVNTVPGMTDHSLVPMAAKAIGCSFEELVWRILESSFPIETGTS